MTRTKRTRLALSWTQDDLSRFLGGAQNRVSRLETGLVQEAGPVSRLLDLLEEAIRAGRAKPGMTPEDVLARMKAGVGAELAAPRPAELDGEAA